MRALLTGFEPYGGRDVNPASEVMCALDGRTVGMVAVIGRKLPVSYEQLLGRIPELLDELKPDIAIGLGLWPGETTIRLERFAANLTDFEIPDNEGAFLE